MLTKLSILCISFILCYYYFLFYVVYVHFHHLTLYVCFVQSRSCTPRPCCDVIAWCVLVAGHSTIYIGKDPCRLITMDLGDSGVFLCLFYNFRLFYVISFCCEEFYYNLKISFLGIFHLCFQSFAVAHTYIQYKYFLDFNNFGYFFLKLFDKFLHILMWLFFVTMSYFTYNMFVT